MKNALKKILTFLGAWGGVALLSSCALLFGKKSQEVSIDSTPQGATVYQDGVEQGKTPLTLTYSKRHVPVVVLEQLGYVPVKVQITRELNALGTLDAVFCWLDLPLLSLIEYEKMLQFKEDNVVVPLQTEEMIRDRKAEFGKYCSEAFRKELAQKPKPERQLAKQRAKREHKLLAQKIDANGGFWLNENVLITPYEEPSSEVADTAPENTASGEKASTEK